MSADAPRPDRMTLSAEEREALICDCADSPPSACVVHGVGYSLALHCPDDLVARAERILAAREQALREEIAGQIKAEAALRDSCADWRDGMDDAARIARGGAR